MPDAPPTEDLVIYADKAKAIKDHDKRMLFITLPIILLYFALVGSVFYVIPLAVSHASGAPSTVSIRAHLMSRLGYLLWFPWILVAEMALLCPAMRRKLSRQSGQIAVLSRDGISVDTIGTHIGLIRWDEIAEIRRYKLFYHYVGIVPKDANLLAKRLRGSSALLLRLNALCVPLYKLFGRFVAPINIPEQYMTLTADELMTQIRAYQTAFSVPIRYDAPQEGVWPPPPQIPR